MACASGTYRSGDAGVGINTCQTIPAGYKATLETATDLGLSAITLASGVSMDGAIVVGGNAYTGSLKTGIAACSPGTESYVGASGRLPLPASNAYSAIIVADNSCSPCAVNMVAVKTGTARCGVCKAGTYPTRSYDPTSAGNQEPGSVQRGPNQCTACPMGFFRAGTSTSATCDACPAGYQTVMSSGATSCTPCPAGAANAAGAWAAVSRTPNGASASLYTAYTSASAVITSAKCALCPVRAMAAAPGCLRHTPPCLLPLAGMCLPLLALLAPRSQANMIASGPGKATCSACPAGTSTPGLGATVCTPCGPGTYSPSTSVGCLLAPSGTFVNTTGAVSYQKCAYGSFASDTGNDKCDICAAGSYSNSVGAKTCKTCPAGYYSSSGATTCAAAPAGSYSAAGASAFIKCPKGTYNDQTHQSQCLDCPPGFACPVTGISQHPSGYGGKYTCSKGQYSTGAAVACKACPVNYFNSLTAQSKCTPCARGTSTRGATGAPTCSAQRGRKFM